MTIRERFLDTLSFKRAKEFPLTEFMGYWTETVTRWENEGLPKGTDVFRHFGLFQMKFIPIEFNFVPAYPKKIIEETDEYVIYVDECNCTKKEYKNSSAMPHYIQFPIKNKKDFYEIKERMNPLSNGRYPENWNELVSEYRNRDYPLGLLIRGPFAFCRDFINFNELMLLFYDDRNFVKEMIEFQTDFTIKLWEKALSSIDVDFIYIGEDLAYKCGTMVSPVMIEELLIPEYRRLTDFFKHYGIENIFLDSDGNIESILPMIIDAGFTGILPIENAAGMNPVKLRDKYPSLKMIGGINKLNIASGKEGIDAEMEKIQVLSKKGGYIPSFDHSVPPIVSYDNYKYYIEKMSENL